MGEGSSQVVGEGSFQAIKGRHTTISFNILPLPESKVVIVWLVSVVIGFYRFGGLLWFFLSGVDCPR